MLTDRQARRRIDRALRELSYSTVEAATERREAILIAFAAFARSFLTNARVTRRPLDSLGAEQLRRDLNAVIAGALGLYASLDRDMDDLARYVGGVIVLAHADLVGEALDDAARRAAFTDLSRRTANLTATVRATVASQRRRAQTIALLGALDTQNALAALDTLLARAIEAQIPETQVATDIATVLAGGEIDYDAYGVERPAITPARSWSYIATVVAVSETFNVMRASESGALAAMGLVETALWTLSPAHRVRDICDTYAERDIGFGVGRYPIRRWPAAPHPFCACSPSNVSVTRFASWVRSWP